MRHSLSIVLLLCLAAAPGLLTGCGDDAAAPEFPRFDAGPMPSPRCDDGVRNGQESHRDCGGPDCDPCRDGLGCNTGDDCQSGVCSSGFCLIATCDDGVKNGLETDVDCGAGCGPCEGGAACSGDADCISLLCEGGLCRPTSCDNGVLDEPQGETDVDCGGPCMGCPGEAACLENDDCVSLNCVENVCGTASCSDGVRNQDETDVDCGGETCEARCDDRLGCEGDDDCINDVCSFGTCISCQDGFQNGQETDRDCGGPDCRPCPGGLGCRTGDDCETGACEEFLCISCNDFLQNGDETDVDCGGPSCQPCIDRQACLVDDDCANERCEIGDDGAGTCISCGDGFQNGSETAPDCGGTECDACADLFSCLVPTDCLSGRCVDSVCISCSDRVQNGDETGTDCGGDVCDACPGGLGCVDDDDCLSRVCQDNTGGGPTDPARICAEPDCDDGVRNGLETDVDCGGGFCAPCPDGDVCVIGDDCASRVCDAGACATPTCSDGVSNGDETGVDCGGPTGAGGCPRCADGEVCDTAADCTSDACTFLLCGDDPCTAVADGPEDDYEVCDFVTPATDVIEDISTTGTELVLTDDGNARVSLPFDFELWGVGYSQVYINANGGLSFGTVDGSIAPLSSVNTAFPKSGAPSRLICAYWDDLDPTRSPGAVYYETLGSSPDRRFVVQWQLQHSDTPAPLSSDTRIDVRVALYEGSSQIEVFYRDTSFDSSTLDGGLSATAGIHELFGMPSWQYSFNRAVLEDGLVIRYTPTE